MFVLSGACHSPNYPRHPSKLQSSSAPHNRNRRLRAPNPWGGGYAWFDKSKNGNWNLLADGMADNIVPITYARDTVSHLKQVGLDATLVEYPLVPHTISRAMGRQIVDLVGREVRKQR